MNRTTGLMVGLLTAALGCRSIPTIAGAIRTELASVRDIPDFPRCLPFAAFENVSRLECQAVEPLVDLLADPTPVEFTVYGYQVQLGDIAFMTLAELDPALWEDLAKSNESSDQTLYRFGQDRGRLSRLVRDRGIRCRKGGISARRVDKFCPDREVEKASRSLPPVGPSVR